MPRPAPMWRPRLALRIGHAEPVRAIAHSPSRRLLATGDDLGHVLVCDRITGDTRVIRPPAEAKARRWRVDRRPRAPGAPGVGSLCFVGEDTLVLANWMGVEAYDVASTRLLHAWPELLGGVSGDGTCFWAWRGEALVRVDPQTGGVVREVPLTPPVMQAGSFGEEPRVDVRSRRIAQVQDGVLRAWDVDAGALVGEHRIAPAGDYPSTGPAALSPDGTEVVAMGPERLVVLTLTTDTIRELPAENGLSHTAIVWLDEGIFFFGTYAFSCWDGERVTTKYGWASGLAAESPPAIAWGSGHVEVMPPGWRPAEKDDFRDVLSELARFHGVPNGLPTVRSVVCRADTVVATYTDRVVRSWSLVTGALIAAVRPPWGDLVVLGQEGTHAVSVAWGVAVWVWEVATSRVVWQHDVGREGSPGTDVPFFRPVGLAGGRLAALVGDRASPHLGVWDVASGERVVWQALPWEPREVALATTGHVALAHRRGELLLVSPEGVLSAVPEPPPRMSRGRNGRPPEPLWIEPCSLVWSPDGTRLVVGHVAGWVEEIRLDPPGRRLLRAHMDSVHAATSVDGHLAGATDYDTRIWHFDPTTRMCQALPGHRGPTRAVAFSPDGRWLVSGATDGAVCVHDATTGRLVVTFQVLPGGDRWISHTPSGAWRGDGAEGFVGDGYSAAPPAEPAKVVRALRRAGRRQAEAIVVKRG